MSFQMVCDICGEDSGRGKAIFNTGPMELVIKNHADREFIVFVNVSVQDKGDKDFIAGLHEKTQEELAELTTRDDLVIKTPDPFICIACQRGLAHQVMKDGFLREELTCETELKVSLEEFIIPPDDFDFDDDDDYDDYDEEDVEDLGSDEEED